MDKEINYQKKKLLIIGPGMEIGGVERSLIGLLDAIDYSEYDVDLFLYAHTGELMPLINRNVNLLPENKYFSLINWPIKKLLFSGHFLMFSLRLGSKLFGAARAKITGNPSQNTTICKKIVSFMSPSNRKHYDIALGFFQPHYYLNEKVDADIKIGWVHTDYANTNERPDINFSLPMLEKLDRIACVSEQVKTSFDTVFPSLKNKTIVIENIISPEFVRKQADEPDVSAEMSRIDGCVNVLSVGRFCTAKAFDIVPDACAILTEKNYPIRWYLIGYGPDEELIRKKISETHMEEHVIVLGKKENPHPYMKACDIYAQPSRYEGKAVTVREAQILNKPVLITRYATASSQLEEGVDGYICEPGAEGIAAGIMHMIDDSQLRQRFIDNTRKRDYGNLKETEKIFALKDQ